MLRKTAAVGAMLLSLVITSRDSRVSAGEPRDSENERTLVEPGAVRLKFESAVDDEVAEEGDGDTIASRIRADSRKSPKSRRAGKTLLTGAEDPSPLTPYDAIYDETDISSLPPEPTPVCAVDCPEFWEHRNAVWGEYLLLRPRGTDIVYASTVDGTLATSVPTGDRSVSAFAYDSGFRVGLGWAIDRCSSITANYTWYETTTIDSVGLPGNGNFLLAETVHPNTNNVAADSLASKAFYDIQLQMADLNYKALITGGDDYALNYLIGVKYARLEQDFQARYSILGTTNVDTNVNFDGMGPRFGLEGEKQTCCGFLGYAKASVNFLVGTCNADFTQTNAFTGIQARTGLEDSRVLTVPELEVGGGWQSKDGCIRITAGYYLMSWFNLLTTPEYLSTVRTTQNSYEHEVRTLTLDGLSTRIEYRF